MSAVRRPGSGRLAGFTLIEVLITLLIMSGILVTITQILNAARTRRDTIHNIEENQLAGPAILDLIEHDLRSLFVFNRHEQDILRVTNRVKAGKDGDSIDFVTGVNGRVFLEHQGRLLRADVNETGYRLRPNPDDDDFLEIWRREAFGVDVEPFDGGTYTFLHDRVRTFDILIWPDDDPETEPVEEWGGDAEFSGLPHRIEIELTLELAPRIAREQLPVAMVDDRTVVYKRVIRFPQALFRQLEVQPVPVVSTISKPQALGGPGSPDDPDAPGGPGTPGAPGASGAASGNAPFGESSTSGSGDVSLPFGGGGGS